MFKVIIKIKRFHSLVLTKSEVKQHLKMCRSRENKPTTTTKKTLLPNIKERGIGRGGHAASCKFLMNSMKKKHRIFNVFIWQIFKNVHFNLPSCGRCSENSTEFAKICLEVLLKALRTTESSRVVTGQTITK